VLYDHDFRSSLPDLSLFPRAAWVRATRSALQVLPDELLGYIDPRGLLSLRQALADYLGRVRGVSAGPEHIVVCGGFSHGLSLTARALRDADHQLIAIEDPGHLDARARIEWNGVRHCAVDVDAHGVVVDHLQASAARAVVVTPAHQYPTGALLSPARRNALIEWARDRDGFVIEDDYDAEFRYDRHPVGAIQGVAPERVIYVGSLSKSLVPGLRLGWMAVPPALVDSIAAARSATDLATSSILQATFATFLEQGDLDRHLRRSRRTYRQRRDALVAALARWLPSGSVSGIAAGLHLLVTFSRDVDEAALVEAAASHGVAVHPLGTYRATPRPDAAPALVLGYGALTPAAIDRGVRRLGAAVEDLTRRS
jgi:GntR family transcriptional regulator / MocR family aminotransferase